MMTGMTETRWSVLSALPPLLSVWEHHRVGSGATLCWEVPFKRAWLCPGARAPSCSWGLVQVQSLPYLGSDKTVVQAGWVSGLTYLTFQHPTPSFWHFLSCCKLWGCLWPPYWSAQRPAQPSFFMRKCVNLPRHPSPFLIGDKEVSGKDPACQCRRRKDTASIPGLGRSPGERRGNPFQCSCLENPTDRGTWWAIVHRVTKSQTRLKKQPT